MKGLLDEDFFVVCVFDADVCRSFDATTERLLKQYLLKCYKTWKWFEKDKWVKEMLVGSKMDKACELAEKYKGRDSYSEIYKAIKKVSESLQ